MSAIMASELLASRPFVQQIPATHEGNTKAPVHCEGNPLHWKQKVVILTTFSSLVAPEVVRMTTSGAASDEKVVNMTTFWFQCSALWVWVTKSQWYGKYFHVVILSVSLSYRTDSRFAPSQWETSMQSKAVCHWLGASLESPLSYLYLPDPPLPTKANTMLVPIFSEKNGYFFNGRRDFAKSWKRGHFSVMSPRNFEKG